MVNEDIKPLLRLFGIEEEYGLSLFCKNFIQRMNPRSKWNVSSKQVKKQQIKQKTLEIVTVAVTSPVPNVSIIFFVMIIMKSKCLLKGLREW